MIESAAPNTEDDFRVPICKYYSLDKSGDEEFSVRMAATVSPPPVLSLTTAGKTKEPAMHSHDIAPSEVRENVGTRLPVPQSEAEAEKPPEAKTAEADAGKLKRGKCRCLIL